MREDMEKLFFERPRRGGGWERPPTRKSRNTEDAPASESMQKPLGGRRRHTRENFAPMENFLQGQIGRPWDKVYSEIRASVKMNNSIQQGFADFLRHYVVQNVTIVDGKVHGTSRRYSSENKELPHGHLYVCPKSGLLKKYRMSRIDKKGLSLDRKVFHRISKSMGAYKIEEIWYEITLSPLPPEPAEYGVLHRDARPYYSPVLDAVLGKVDVLDKFWKDGHSPFCSDTRKAYGDGDIYATAKRQMSSKKIKQLGL